MKSISSCPYMEIRKIYSWKRTPQDQSVTVKRSERAIRLRFQCCHFAERFKQKDSMLNTSAITAVTKVSMNPQSSATANRHLRGSEERNREQRRTKVSFGTTMMRALKPQQLAKRLISGQSDIEQ